MNKILKLLLAAFLIATTTAIVAHLLHIIITYKIAILLITWGCATVLFENILKLR